MKATNNENFNRTFEYQMPSKLAEAVLSTNKKKKGEFDSQEYLIEYVNNECGLIGNCTKVIIV